MFLIRVTSYVAHVLVKCDASVMGDVHILKGLHQQHFLHMLVGVWMKEGAELFNVQLAVLVAIRLEKASDVSFISRFNMVDIFFSQFIGVLRVYQL